MYTHNHTRTHAQVIPKVRDGLTQLSKAREDQKSLLGHMLYVAQSVAKQEGLDKGFRVVVNDGPDGCESREGGNQCMGPDGLPLLPHLSSQRTLIDTGCPRSLQASQYTTSTSMSWVAGSSPGRLADCSTDLNSDRVECEN